MHLPGPGGSHDPTALALVIDNSMSTTVIRRREAPARHPEGGGPAQSVTAAGPRRCDLGCAGRDVHGNRPIPGRACEEARAAIDAIRPAATPAGDLGRADGARPVRWSGRATCQSGRSTSSPTCRPPRFPNRSSPHDDGQSRWWSSARPRAPRLNRGIGDISFGGGLPPLAGRSTEAAVSVVGGAAGDTVGVRLYIDGQVRAAARGPGGRHGASARGAIPSGAGGRLRGDRPRSSHGRRPALLLLRRPGSHAGRGPRRGFRSSLPRRSRCWRRTTGSRWAPPGAPPRSSASAAKVSRAAASPRALVVAPHPDPAQLPALNRRLAEAGIPYRYEMEAGGGARLASSDLAVDLAEVEIRRFFRLVPTGPRADGAPQGGDPATGSAADSPPAGARSGSVVMLSSGDPWLVTANSPAGPYTLLASPLDGESTSLPVSAAMVPLLEWAIERWSGGGRRQRIGHGRDQLRATRRRDFRAHPRRRGIRGGRRSALPGHNRRRILPACWPGTAC